MASIGGFFRALMLIWQHGDALAPLLDGLRSSLPITGQAMVASGESAEQVGKVLKARGGLPITAEGLTDRLKESIRQSREQLADVEQYLRDAGDAIKAIKVPAITFQTTTLDLGLLGKYDFATGMGVANVSPFTPVHDGLDGIAGLVHNVTAQLHANENVLRDLSDMLGTAGGHLQTLGHGLKEGGRALQGQRD
jgi:hypothetical protein